MTVATTDNVVNHVGNGVTTVFAFAFKTLDVSHIRVYLDSVEQGAGFTVNLNADQDAAPGGTVTMGVAPIQDEVLTIQRYLPTVQNTDYNAYDPFPAETHEKALDELTMMVQQLQEQLDRTTQTPIGGA